MDPLDPGRKTPSFFRTEAAYRRMHAATPGTPEHEHALDRFYAVSRGMTDVDRQWFATLLYGDPRPPRG